MSEHPLNQLVKPEYIPDNYNAFQLIKICKSEKYLNDFMSGRFYMSTIKNISNIESKDLTKGQLDRLEGTEEYWQKTETNYIAMDISEGNYMFKYFHGEPEDKSGLIEIYNIETGRSNNISKNIYCMYTMWFDTINRRFWSISPKIIDNLGGYAAIIKEPYELINRYNSALMDYFSTHKYNSIPTLGFVEYIDIKNKGITPLGIYRKRDDFIYQNEFRLCLDIKDNHNDLCYFEVGDLSDIVVPVKTKDLVYNTKIDKNCLIIGDTKINCHLFNHYSERAKP